MPGPQEQDLAEVISKLHDQLGEELLSVLLRATTSEIRVHVDERKPPVALVAARAAYLSELLEHLSGTYNVFGIQRWFQRQRSQLDGRSPLEHLLGEHDWTPDDKAAIEVAMLARASRYMLAT